VRRRRRQHPVDDGVGWIGRNIVAHDDPDADPTFLRLPVGDGVGDGRIVGIDRLDQAEPVGVLCLHFEDVARVVSVHRERRYQHRTSTPTASIAATI
jgi:hypothetical protein